MAMNWSAMIINSFLFASPLLYLALMLFPLLIIADADEEDAACVFGNLRRIFLALYLVDGGVGSVVELQLHDECRLCHIAPGNHHEVGISLSCGILSVEDVFVLCPDIRYGEHTGEGVLVVVGKNAGMLVMGLVDALRHGLLVAGESGGEEVLRGCQRICKTCP